jgi:asparagine N-glycosylation enzyme membrane subunit Stt3
MPIVLTSMAVVIAGFFGLALTDSRSARESRPGLRLVAVSGWLVIVIAGWFGLAYAGANTSGGLHAAWTWARDQSPLMQIAMWLFLLPWMIAMWIWQAPWALSLRIALFACLALLTIALAAMQFARSTKGA